MAQVMLEQRHGEELYWHLLPEEEILDHLESSRNGLTPDEVERRQEEYGRNVFPEAEPLPLWRIILDQFLSPLIYILLIAGVISLFIGEVAEAIFILVVVLLNASLGAFQEWRAEQSAAALQSLLKISALVRRDGADQEIDSEELVPGDIVILESGTKVPADLRLLRANNLSIDESFLTGESIAVDKDTAVLDEEELSIGDRVNMAYAGSTVMTGRGLGMVVATGLATQLGKVAEAATEPVETSPPLVLRMERFVKQITYVVLGAVVLLAIISLFQGRVPQEIFYLAIALAVSAIPEGLPVAITVALSIGVNRMAKQNVIVRRMTAVEGLGSCTYIASDKTGTLTVNRQTAKAIWLATSHQLSASGEGYAGEGEVTAAAGDELDAQARLHLERLGRAAIINNEGSLVRQDGEWNYTGDAMDVALLALGYKMGLDPRAVRTEVEPIAEIPFESERRYSATAYRDNGQVRVAVKGGTERLLDFSNRILATDGETELDREAIGEQALQLASGGYRVLAVADGELPEGTDLSNFAEDDLPPLTLLGLVGFIDPLRPEALEAVQKCHRAGVDVAMVTGDHPATALAISRELGIADSADDVVTGSDLGDMDAADPEFRELVGSVHVFARVSPLQKLRIVEALAAQGHYVAVTGDGVNDAPALNAAHIGVAMGSGTDVAKDTASIIVTDDNFASIERGIEEGRFAYDNIRKVIYLLISAGVAEILLFLLAIITGLPLPLRAAQILWLNLVTNGIQDVALAFEGGEPGAMERPPRHPDEGIFNRLMIQQTLVSGTWMGLVAFGTWFALLQAGMEEGAARNLLLLLMVLFQNFHVFNCRSELESAFRVPLSRNRVLIFGVAAAFGLHVLAMYFPLLQGVLQVAPVSLREFITLLFMASTILIVMEIFKAIKRRTAARVSNVGRVAGPGPSTAAR
jgi:magnesium-transporting ATPase (P-type)